MNIRRHVSTTNRNLALAVIFVVIAALGGFFAMARVNAVDQESGRLVTIYDRGEQKVFLSQGETVGDALKEAGIDTDDHDVVEPALTEKMVASEYKVNIYRARPVTIVDGAVRQKVMTPYQTPVQIAKDAGITLYSEDETQVSQSSDYLYSGAGLQLSIHRATPVQFTLYGKTATARTQGATVADMLREKDIALGEHDRVSPAPETPISENLEVRVWREGKQTVTVEEEVAFPTESIQDADREVGYKEVRTAGQNGTRNVTYEVVIQDGREVSRSEIASVTTKEPIKQVQVVGAKSRYSSSVQEWLLALRTCETGGRYAANTGNGYYGAYQFMDRTWDNAASKSGRPDLIGVRPDLALPADQDAMVIANTRLSKTGLASQHPGCYKKLGLSAFPPQ